MAELINRPEYLNKLIQNRDVDLVKIVTGIRRCGKSSLLDLFHQHLTDNGVPNANICLLYTSTVSWTSGQSSDCWIWASALAGLSRSTETTTSCRTLSLIHI